MVSGSGLNCLVNLITSTALAHAITFEQTMSSKLILIQLNNKNNYCFQCTNHTNLPAKVSMKHMQHNLHTYACLGYIATDLNFVCIWFV